MKTPRKNIDNDFTINSSRQEEWESTKKSSRIFSVPGKISTRIKPDPQTVINTQQSHIISLGGNYKGSVFIVINIMSKIESPNAQTFLSVENNGQLTGSVPISDSGSFTIATSVDGVGTPTLGLLNGFEQFTHYVYNYKY